MSVYAVFASAYKCVLYLKVS